MTDNPVPDNVITPPEVVVIRDFDEFLEKGQSVEEAMSDEQARAVTPLDLLSSRKYTTAEIKDERLDICLSCERLWKPTRTCRECGCFMGLKAWLKNAECPIGKWGTAESAGKLGEAEG